MRDPAPRLVGVAGGSGAGKTTIVRALAQKIGAGRVSVMQHDWYYRDRSPVTAARRAELNYDHPDALETELLVSHLDALRGGRRVEAPSYDFATHSRRAATHTVEPRELVVLEGILLLHDAALRAALDLRVWVDADDDVRFIRRLQRDTRERGRSTASVVEQYLRSVRPMYVEFVAPSRRFADLVLDGQGELVSVLNALEHELERRVGVRS